MKIHVTQATKATKANLVIVIRKRKIGKRVIIETLLGLKKKDQKTDIRKKVGAGKWTPPGGKLEPSDESLRHSAQRELREETAIELKLNWFWLVGFLEGYPNKSTTEPIWEVSVYLVEVPSDTTFVMDKTAYDKMDWFPLGKIPWNKMQPKDRKWLPKAVKKKYFCLRVNLA